MTDTRIDDYIDALPAWQQDICHEAPRAARAGPGWFR
jgi:hypothetical protein